MFTWVNRLCQAHEKMITSNKLLYLQGGIKEGSWVWGRIGSVNGCLLWPDAFNFFVKKILPFTKGK
jgi:hypothetical protein